MSETEEKSVDVLLRWKGTGGDTRRDSAKDSVAVADTDDESAELAECVTEKPEAGEQWSTGEDLVEDDSDDLFEWSEDREQALMDALDFAPAGAVPRVHQQLEAIARALEEKSIDSEQASILLSEVDDYLESRLQREHQKRPVSDPVFMQARADKINALTAYLEASSALRKYGSENEAVQLKIARYAAEQGSSFLSTSRDALMDAEPEFEEEYDEEDDFEEDDFEEDEEHEDESAQ